MNNSTIQAHDIYVKETSKYERDNIVSLFYENNITYNWNIEKWNHYYLRYPEGESISIVAKIGDNVIGHYGMLPVKIADFNAMLGVHAYISKKYRGLTVLSKLMQYVDEFCQSNKIDLICGFANKNFAYISKQFFKWYVPFWIDFKSDYYIPVSQKRNKKFKFNYSTDWFLWRFDSIKSHYISLYTNDQLQNSKQFLKSYKDDQDLLFNEILEFWTTNDHYTYEPKDRFAQPFCLKIYNIDLFELDILNPYNWWIDMADSDTFIYNPCNVE